MGKILASEYNTWYTRLNAIRSKHGVAALSYTPAISKTSALSSQMTTLRTSMITVANTTCHVPDVSTYDIGNVNHGSKILLDTNNKINVIVANMEAVCHHNANDGDDSDYDNCYQNGSDNGNKSDNGDNSVKSNHGDNNDKDNDGSIDRCNQHM